MQGNLSEIDIRSILQLIDLGQRTGELFVKAYSSSVGSSMDQPQQHFLREPSWAGTSDPIKEIWSFK